MRIRNGTAARPSRQCQDRRQLFSPCPAAGLFSRVAPPPVVSRETQDQRADLPTNRRPPGSPRVRPSLRHQAPMPAQQRPNPPNHYVAQREEHEASRVAGSPCHSTLQPTDTYRS
jgi:hypothetical protein